MNSKDFFILIVIIVMLFAALFGSHVQAQKVVVDKKVEIINQTNKPDSTVVILKTSKSNKPENGNEGLIIDSLIQVFTMGSNSGQGQTVKIMTIHNGDTVIKESHSDTFDPKLFEDFNVGGFDEGMLKSMFQSDMHNDSILGWSSRFDSMLDPLTFDPFGLEWTGDINEMDSIMERQFKLNIDENGDQMIVLNDNGDEIMFGPNYQTVFLNKNEDTDSIQSEIKVNNDGNRKKVVVVKTRIQLDELSKSEKADLKSKGLKTSTKEPEFDYLKFYPNPSAGAINIQFRTSKPIDTEVKINNSQGKTLFEEKLSDFSGEYNKSINLSDNGPGTYLLQIVQGKKAITRKIIVD